MAIPPRIIALDHEAEVARGRIGGQTVMRKFGHNADIATSFENIWELGGSYTGWLTTAVEVRVKAGGDAADTTDGNNARSVTIVGLDDTWADASETVATAGASASVATTTKFFRVFRCFVAGVGVAGNSNAAAITIETTGGVTVAEISTGNGQTQMALYTVPAGKTAYLDRLRLKADSARTVDFRLFRREDADASAAPFGPMRIVSEYNSIGESGLNIEYPSKPSFPAKTDIITEALADAGGTSAISVEFDLTLVDD